jgi:hypothetical protein
MNRFFYCLLDPQLVRYTPTLISCIGVAKGTAEEEVAAHSGKARSSTSYGDRVGRVLSMLSPASGDVVER